jgi:hypothetical protein
MSAIRQGTPIDVATTVILFLLVQSADVLRRHGVPPSLHRGGPVLLVPHRRMGELRRGPATTLDRIRDVAWHLVLPVATYTAGTLAR